MLPVNHKDKRGFLAPLRSTRLGSASRLVTRRSVCFTFILTLCSISLMASLSQISIKTMEARRKQHVMAEDDPEFLVQPGARVFLQARIRAVVPSGNERVSILAGINTNSVKKQGMLTLRKQQNKRKKSENAPKYEVGFRNEEVRVYSILPNGTFENVGNKKAYDDIAIMPLVTTTTKKGVLEPGKDRSSALPDPESPDGKSAYDNTASVDESSKQEEDYGEIIGPQIASYDYDLEIDPVRQSFLYNVSKYLDYFKKHKGNHKYYNQPVSLLPKQTKGVVILTNYRSGSTFLGELFNQHPDAFYTFEPLFPFTGGCGIQGARMKQLVHQILKCDFPSMMDVYEQVRGPMRKNSVDINCLLENFCFRKYTKELCEEDLCALGKPKGGSCRRCGPVHLPRVMNVCRAKKVSVVKAIRLCDIQNLKTVIDDPSMDIKIVHLVRDPRGIESSRMKIHKKWPIKANAETTCDRLLHNGMFGLANTTKTKWLKNRYMRVRYEDLSLEPLSMAKEIYKFVGLDFLPEVQAWINRNTRASSRKKINPYTTKRDSASAMQAWRKHLTLSQVKTVQSVCSDAMDFYGYKPVANQTELLNLDVKLLR